MTIDICLSPSENMLGAPVLMTVTDADSAQSIADAINSSTIYQGEHLIAWTRETNRDEPGDITSDDRTSTSGAPVAAEGAEG
jgi:hypothetical protein